MLLALLVAMVPAVAVAQSGGQLGIRLVDAPTDRADDPRARIYIVDHLNVGATIERRIELSNSTARDLEVDLYAGAADIADAGWQPEPGRAENELTDWIEISPSQVAVPANGTVQATVTIRVPGEVSAAERYAVIWAEPPSGQSGGATVTNRVGIRVYLSAGEGEEPVSDFVVDSLTASRAEDGTPVVTARVENTGQRALDLGGDLVLEEGPGGLRAGPFPAELGTTLAPGDEGPVTVELDPSLPDGPWLATITLTSGRITRAAQGTITFPSEAGATADPVDAVDVPLYQDRGILLPVALLLFLLAFLLVSLVWWRAKKRQAAAHDRDAPVDVGEPV